MPALRPPLHPEILASQFPLAGFFGVGNGKCPNPEVFKATYRRFLGNLVKSCEVVSWEVDSFEETECTDECLEQPRPFQFRSFSERS